MNWKAWGDHPVIVGILVSTAVVSCVVGVIGHFRSPMAEKRGEDLPRDNNKKDHPESGQHQLSPGPQQPELSPRDPKSISPRELSGSITLSQREGALGVCVQINGFPNGLPGSHAPVFHAWVPGSAIDIPMIFGDDDSCKNGYTLESAAPAISQGGTMRIYENSQPLDWVNVGSFTVAGSQGCLDVGRVESFTISWMKGGKRERASTSGIPVNGDYGWVCRV